MPEALTHNWPAWIAIAISVLLGVNRLIEESEKFAGFFGKWARKIHARHQEDLVIEKLAEVVRQVLDSAHDEWESEGNEAMRAMAARLETMSDVSAQQKEDIDELLFQVRCSMGYGEYEALWHHRLRLAATNATGTCLPLADIPNHIDYYRFESMYRSDTNWRTWANTE